MVPFSSFFLKIVQKNFSNKFEIIKELTWFDGIFGMITCRQNFFSLTLRAKPLHFYLENVFFFFFTKNVILLVHLNHFPHYFLFIFERMSLPSWFWKNPCYVFDPISLVNENNDHFCTFIVKKCQFPCVSYACSTFKLKSFPLVFTFSFDTFIWIIKKYHLRYDFNALFLIILFLKFL